MRPSWWAFAVPNVVLAGLVTWRFGLMVGAGIAYGVLLGVMGVAMWRQDDEATVGEVAGQVPAADA